MARRNRLRSHRKSHTGRNLLFILLLLLIAGAGAAGFILFETEKPTIAVGKKISHLGSSAQLPISATDNKSGLRSVVLELEQNGSSKQLFNRTFQRKAWFSKAGPGALNETVEIRVQGVGAKDGKAVLILTARDFSLNGLLKGNETSLRIPVIIDTRAPRAAVEHAQRYIRPGGSGIVVYSLSEKAARHGVEINDMFFPGFPLKGTNRYIAYIMLPWNAGKPETSRVVAIDEAGNTGKAVFTMHFKKVPEKKDRINVSDGFLNRKIPEFEMHYPELTGTPVEKFIYINNVLRKRNAEVIHEICTRQPEEIRLWKDRFLRMPGAGRAGYADQRTYYYKGQPIDHQTHLGMDIASTAHASVRAANSGKVIFSDYLGIYGNTVIIDHGQGVASLYSHLSRIETTPDTMLAQDDLIGYSGATGMAGGDHLHFSMLIHGRFVTPKEWWDQHWIDVNINDIIGEE